MLIYFDCGDIDLPPPAPIATTHTDESGYFVFDCLAPLDIPQCALGDVYCEYCVEPGDADIPDGWISAYDASLILQHFAQIDPLDRCPFDFGYVAYPQRIAGDVDCSNGVQDTDANLVLQYVVGLITDFPGCPPWVWVPERFCTSECPDRLDFIGVLKGDVSGPMPDPVQAPAYIKMGIPRHYYQGDVGFVEIPVRVRDALEVFSIEFTLNYDETKLTPISVVPAGLASAYSVAYNDLGGTIDVALAGIMSFSGSGRIAMVTFQKNGQRVPIAQMSVGLDAALFNEGDPPAIIEGHEYDGEIVRFGLGPVSPNPFSDGTVITYSAPQAATVAVKIFNVHGQVVRTVLNGEVGAGVHQVSWDGCDDAGARVARGVYFCRMEAGGFSATEKLVFLQ
jgi:hypothetical protein